MTETWDGDIERVAAYLYRDEHGWGDGPTPWRELVEADRTVYQKRAHAVAAMLHFPHDAQVVSELARLCVCDPNPETTDGPQRECPIHGELPEAVIRIGRILWAAERYVMAGLCGNPDVREELATLIEAARTDRDPFAPMSEGGECYPCAHGGTHGTDYCRLCEQQTEDEGPAYCAVHDE